MQIITPPTDNLYKFLAIGGLVVFVASFVVPKQVEYALRDKQFRKITEYAKAKSDYEIWQGAEKRLIMQKQEWEANKKQLTEFKKEHRRDELPEDVAQVLKQEVIDGDKRILEFWNTHEKNAMLAAVADQGIGLMKSIDEENKYWEAEAKWTGRIFQWCFWIGIAMSVGGFAGWWCKIQIPHDEMTQLELAAKRQASGSVPEKSK